MQSLTVIRTAPNRLQTKNLITGETYAKTSRLVDTFELPANTLKELRRALRQLADDPNACVIRGELRPEDERPSGPLRRRKTHFADEPRAWVMLDIDDLRLPKRLQLINKEGYTAEHIHFARTKLPPEFQNASCVWQASASAGVDGRVLKAHLWFLLDAPLTAAQLRRWFKRMDTRAIDKSTLRCVQPHYVADPIGGERFYIGKRIGMHKGTSDRVETPEDIDATMPGGEAQDYVALEPRPEGVADVAKAQVKGAKRSAKSRAEAKFNSPDLVPYQDAYIIGTYYGAYVALKHWNDDNGHEPECWSSTAEKIAARWSLRLAELPGAHDAGMYEARITEGIVWGMSNERARLATHSDRAVEEARERTRAMQERLLAKLMRNSGSERVLREVGQELGRYQHVIGREELLERLRTYSGLSEAQCEDAIADVEPVDTSAWREGLLFTPKGDLIEACDENIIRILNQHPDFRRSFEYNVRTHNIEASDSNVLGVRAGVVDIETIDADLVEWLGSLGMRRVSRAAAYGAFKSFVPKLVHYDPFLRRYPEALLSRSEAQRQLDALEHRPLRRWLFDYMGAVGSKKFIKAAAVRTLVGAVARAVRPGCEMHTMLVLRGEQGIGKTRVIKALAGVIDGGYKELLDMRDRDAVLGMQSGLLVEVSELRALRNNQEEHAKAFMSRSFDHVRAPYARKAEEHLRRMVFIGTTNDEEFLTDTTNRRYWPVECSGSDRVMTTEEADALWREAALRYAAGAIWWLEEPELKELQHAASSKVRELCEIETVLSKQLRSVATVTLDAALRLVYPDAAELQRYYRRGSRVLRVLGFSPKHTKNSRKWVRDDA